MTTPSVEESSVRSGQRLASDPSDSAVQPKPVWQTKLDRWLAINELSFSARYRSVTDSNNTHEYDQAQQRSVIDGTFKADKAGRYGVTFHLSSGHYFNWAYADFIGGGAAEATPLQIRNGRGAQKIVLPRVIGADKEFVGSRPSGGWALLPRRLYGFAEPIAGLQFQYGSIDINRGAGSEITTYDNDGYIAGERLLIKLPSKLFFDEYSVTVGYFGDIYSANFFDRGDRLSQSNYHQFLVRKKAFKRLDVSVDYTRQDGAKTIREAAAILIPESRVVDLVRFEAYDRLNDVHFRGLPNHLADGNGFAVTASKKLHHVSMEGGIAHIDTRYAIFTQQNAAAILGLGVNGDQYGLGNRFWIRPTIQVTPYLSLSGFYTHTYSKIADPFQVIWNKQALNAGLNIDLKRLFFPAAEAK